jgi:hypothetical protein
MARALFVLWLAACNKGDPSDSTSETDGDADTDADADADSDADTDSDTEPTDVNPVVNAVDAWCWHHTVGEERWLWGAAAAGDDPQGSFDLKGFGNRLTVLEGATEITTYVMVCQDDGDCTANWNQDEFGILCDQATSYTIRVELEDDEDHWSAPVEVQGRIGTDESG